MPELVSAIIPTYNRADLLVRALASVVAQEYRPIEVVIVDDGSTDHTENVVAEKTPVLRQRGVSTIFHRQQNQRAAKARNMGMKLATGSLFAFLDSDDLWKPVFLSTVVGLLERHPACGLGFCGILGIDFDDTVYAERQMGIDPVPEEGVLHAPFEAILRYMPTQTSGVVVRCGVIEAVGDFDPALPVVEDWDLWYRIAKKYDFCYTVRALACNRNHPDNLPKLDIIALSSSIRMNLQHLPDVTDPATRQILIARLRQQMTLLQEQLMRENKPKNGAAQLLEHELAPRTFRYRLGTAMRSQPQWMGHAYARLVRAVGDLNRKRR